MASFDDSGLQEELEVLEAIYHEVEVTRNAEGEVTSITIQLHPATGEEMDKRYVCMTLQLQPPPQYPDEPPQISIRNPRGIGEEELQSLLEDMHYLAEERQGGPMLYELIELAKESLTEGNIPHCTCMICLEHFHEGEQFTRTHCYHYFHHNCLARYVQHAVAESQLQDKKLTLHTAQEQQDKVMCPVCREEIEYNASDLDHMPEEEEVKYKPSAEMLAMQIKMATMFERQQARGGIIDVEAEKNRYLVTDDDLVVLPGSRNILNQDRPSSCPDNRSPKASRRAVKGDKSDRNVSKREGNRPRPDSEGKKMEQRDERRINSEGFVRGKGRGQSSGDIGYEKERSDRRNSPRTNSNRGHRDDDRPGNRTQGKTKDVRQDEKQETSGNQKRDRHFDRPSSGRGRGRGDRRGADTVRHDRRQDDRDRKAFSSRETVGHCSREGSKHDLNERNISASLHEKNSNVSDSVGTEGLHEKSDIRIEAPGDKGQVGSSPRADVLRQEPGSQESSNVSTKMTSQEPDDKRLESSPRYDERSDTRSKQGKETDAGRNGGSSRTSHRGVPHDTGRREFGRGKHRTHETDGIDGRRGESYQSGSRVGGREGKYDTSPRSSAADVKQDEKRNFDRVTHGNRRNLNSVKQENRHNDLAHVKGEARRNYMAHDKHDGKRHPDIDIEGKKRSTNTMKHESSVNADKHEGRLSAEKLKHGDRRGADTVQHDRRHDDRMKHADRRSDDRMKHDGRTDDRTKHNGRSDDRTKNDGRSNDRTKHDGRSDDRMKHDGRRSDGTVRHDRRSDDRSKHDGRSDDRMKHDNWRTDDTVRHDGRHDDRIDHGGKSDDRSQHDNWRTDDTKSTDNVKHENFNSRPRGRGRGRGWRRNHDVSETEKNGMFTSTVQRVEQRDQEEKLLCNGLDKVRLGGGRDSNHGDNKSKGRDHSSVKSSDTSSRDTSRTDSRGSIRTGDNREVRDIRDNVGIEGSDSSRSQKMAKKEESAGKAAPSKPPGFETVCPPPGFTKPSFHGESTVKPPPGF